MDNPFLPSGLFVSLRRILHQQFVQRVLKNPTKNHKMCHLLAIMGKEGQALTKVSTILHWLFSISWLVVALGCAEGHLRLVLRIGVEPDMDVGPDRTSRKKSDQKRTGPDQENFLPFGPVIKF
jgi:hypothetical protein